MPRLGLALSGGGLRATLFHLGVVRFLRDAGVLGEVTHIVSVSGGSILGAHLALNWERYNGSEADFEGAASKIIAFVQSDARNQIARRIPFLLPLRFLRRLAFRGTSRTVTPTGRLEKLYAKHLYGDARVHQLPEMPELHLLTTNMSEGGLCSFTRAGLIMQHRTSGGTKVETLPARLTPVALAVTASSAFPGFFPPALITADDLGLSEGEFPPHTFTDGGVYDNLGVRAFDLLEHLDPSLDQILVSDVGKPFSISRSHALGMIGRSMRASDILWDRVGQLEMQKFHDDPRFLFVAALDQVDPRDDPTALHPVIQSEVAHIRTDLDRFTPLDITALVQHGYCVARKQCRTRPDLYGSNLPSTPPWDPMKGSDAAGSPHAKTAPGEEGPSRDASPPVTALVTRQAQQLRLSAGRRVWSTLLDLRDWPTYVYIPLLFVLLVVLPVQGYRYRRQANTNAMIVDAITHGSPDFRKIFEIVERNTTRVDPAAGPGRLPGVAEGRLPRVRVRERHQHRRPARLAIEDAGRGPLLPEGSHPETGERGPPGPPVPSPPLRPDRLPRRAGEAEARRTPRPSQGRGREDDLGARIRPVGRAGRDFHRYRDRGEGPRLPGTQGQARELAALLAARPDGASLRVGALPGISAVQGLPPHPLRDGRLLQARGDRDAVHDRPPLRHDHRLVDRQCGAGLRLRVRVDDGMSRLAPWSHVLGNIRDK